MKKRALRICIALGMLYTVGAVLCVLNVFDFGLFPNVAVAQLQRTFAFADDDNQSSANRPTVTRERCNSCHEEEVASFERTSHGASKKFTSADEAKVCGSCHGNSVAKHGSGDKTVKPTEMKTLSALDLNAKCLSCHKEDDHRSNASLSVHTGAGVSCISCHDVHPSEAHMAKMVASGRNGMFGSEEFGKLEGVKATASNLCLSCHKTEDAQFSQTTHHRLKEGVMDCLNCHNPHGSTEEKLLVADKKEVCVKCHQDKRGPFMFEHGAMANSQGCVTCHEQHGGGGAHLLKARDPKTLCMSCHAKEAIGMHGVSGVQYNNGIPTGGLTSAGDCTRCHEEIHGSNSSPFFHR